MKHKIWMEEISDLPEGWFCGIGKRCNNAFYRTTNSREANKFCKASAVRFAKEFKDYGYPCKIVPKISDKEIVKILF